MVICSSTCWRGYRKLLDRHWVRLVSGLQLHWQSLPCWADTWAKLSGTLRLRDGWCCRPLAMIDTCGRCASHLQISFKNPQNRGKIPINVSYSRAIEKKNRGDDKITGDGKNRITSNECDRWWHSRMVYHDSFGTYHYVLSAFGRRTTNFCASDRVHYRWVYGSTVDTYSGSSSDLLGTADGWVSFVDASNHIHLTLMYNAFRLYCTNCCSEPMKSFDLVGLDTRTMALYNAMWSNHCRNTLKDFDGHPAFVPTNTKPNRKKIVISRDRVENNAYKSKQFPMIDSVIFAVIGFALRERNQVWGVAYRWIADEKHQYGWDCCGCRANEIASASETMWRIVEECCQRDTNQNGYCLSASYETWHKVENDKQIMHILYRRRLGFMQRRAYGEQRVCNGTNRKMLR